MMKYLNWLIACLITINGLAQDKLVLGGKAPSMYVTYTAASEISLRALSNQFGQSVKRLAAFNGINANATLAHGSKVKIPVTQYSILRTKGDGSNAPVYHVVEKGDNLYRLSKANAIPLAELREWNGFKGDAVKIGQLVIVGFMVNVRATDIKNAEAKKEEPKKAEDAALVKAEVKTEAKSAEIIPQPKNEELKVDDKKSKKKKEDPRKAAETTPKVELKSEPVAEEPKPVAKKETPAEAPDASSPKIDLNNDYQPREGDEGYFAASYTHHPREKSQQFHSGDAATFKTISGWSDRKYYVLINDVAPETIVRITAPNNRSICAKVLGPLQETKGGTGLLLRMSNSAASTLGITDPKFTVTVTYFE